jgi:hypothetical protein
MPGFGAAGATVALASISADVLSLFGALDRNDAK